MPPISDPRSQIRILLALAFVVALLVPLLSTAAIHSGLQSSVPADSATLTTVPAELRLTFTARAVPATTRVQLLGPDSVAVPLGELVNPADSPRVVVAPVIGRLVAGDYAILWQLVGADGHPVRGRIVFTIATGAQGLAPPVASQEPTPHAGVHDAAMFPETGALDVQSPVYAAVRWVNFVAILGVIGAAAFRVLVLSLARRQRFGASAELTAAAALRTARVAFLFALLLAAGAALRFIAQWLATEGTLALRPGVLRGLLLGNAWSAGLLLQFAAAALVLVGARRAASRRGGGWGLVALAAPIVAVTPALSGHAVATDFPWLSVPADALHVLGAGGWLGALLVLLIAGIPAAMEVGEAERGRSVAALVSAFSPTALFFAGVVTATGVLATWIHVGTPPALWQTAYGRTLLLKLAVFLFLFATGAYNYLRVRPTLGSDIATARLKRSAAIELSIALLVLVVTAVLVASAPSRYVVGTP